MIYVGWLDMVGLLIGSGVGWLIVPDFAPSFDLLGVRDDIETYQIALGM